MLDAPATYLPLDFDEANHAYFVAGARLPSVTEVIRPLTDDHYARFSPELLAAARDRGHAVHLATQLDDEKDLDEESVEPEIRPYLEAWRAFRLDNRVEIVLNEQKLYHPTLRYAGTVDRVARFDGATWMLDIKSTSQIVPAVHVQLAGYTQLAEQAGIRIDRRAAVWLRSNGSYRLVPSTDDHKHRAAFVALLSIFRWRETYGHSSDRA